MDAMRISSFHCVEPWKGFNFRGLFCMGCEKAGLDSPFRTDQPKYHWWQFWCLISSDLKFYLLVTPWASSVCLLEIFLDSWVNSKVSASEQIVWSHWSYMHMHMCACIHIHTLTSWLSLLLHSSLSVFSGSSTIKPSLHSFADCYNSACLLTFNFIKNK